MSRHGLVLAVKISIRAIGPGARSVMKSLLRGPLMGLSKNQGGVGIGAMGGLMRR